MTGSGAYEKRWGGRVSTAGSGAYEKPVRCQDCTLDQQDCPHDEDHWPMPSAPQEDDRG